MGFIKQGIGKIESVGTSKKDVSEEKDYQKKVASIDWKKDKKEEEHDKTR